MWGTPVESAGGVLKVIPKTLFSSGTETDMTSAPVFLCLKSDTFAPYSSILSCFTSSYFARIGAPAEMVSIGLVATIFKEKSRGENVRTIPERGTSGEILLDR